MTKGKEKVMSLVCIIRGRHLYHDVSMTDMKPFEVEVKCFRCGPRTIVFDDEMDAKLFMVAVSRVIMRFNQEIDEAVTDFIREHDKP